MTALARAILQARTALAVQTPDTLDTASLYATRDAIWDVSDLLATAYWH